MLVFSTDDTESVEVCILRIQGPGQTRLSAGLPSSLWVNSALFSSSQRTWPPWCVLNSFQTRPHPKGQGLDFNGQPITGGRVDTHTDEESDRSSRQRIQHPHRWRSLLKAAMPTLSPAFQVPQSHASSFLVSGPREP